MSYPPFEPPIRTLMGPGPSDVDPRVLAAMARPTIGHLDPRFVALMDEVKRMLQTALFTDNEVTMVISGPGSAGMEACFVNLVEPGDTVVVCENGVFGGRMRENVERCGGKAIVVRDDWGSPVDPEKLDATLKTHPAAKIVAFVHAETSTGVLSDAAELARVARGHDCLVLMDAVTSFGGVPVRIDEWGIDAVYSGSQKCLSCTPGLSPLSFSERAMQVARKRRTKVQSWFLDIGLVTAYWGSGAKRAYHHTAPINALYGLHEALRLLHEEGVEKAWARHHANHELLRDALESMGLRFPVEPAHRIPHLNAVTVPEGVDDAVARQRMLDEFGLEIGAGLGPLAGVLWRIGLMGTSSSRKNVEYCVAVLRTILGG